MKLEPSNVKYLVVHCAATTASQDVGVKEIDRWHRQRGWLKIGYHFVIRRNGAIERGRTLNEIGAHVQGFNECAVGVCLVGGCKEEKGKLVDDANFTEAQYTTLAKLLLHLKELFPKAEIVAHHDLNPGKSCPTFDVRSWVLSLGTTA